MQLIDEKGRVLGIVNIVDLTVLLFIISATTGFAWLYYTGELFKDHDPAKKFYTYANVTAIIKDQNFEAVNELQLAIAENMNTSITPQIPIPNNIEYPDQTNDLVKQALIEKQNNIAKIRIINITLTQTATNRLFKISSTEIMRKEPSYEILVNVQLPVKRDIKTNIPYLYHPFLHRQIEDVPLLEKSDILIATGNLTFKSTIIGIM